MSRLFLSFFWLGLGAVFLLGPKVVADFPPRIVFGVNVGWIGVFLAVYNFAWWAGRHPWSAPKPRDEGPTPRPRPAEYNPELDFTRPDDSIQEKK